MTHRQAKVVSLRKKAETALAQQENRLRELSAVDLKKLVHELGTHQIELEMQNEELRRAQAELESSRRQYADLYDFSPVGYLTLDRNGLIREANHTGASMLGVVKRSLIDRPFQNFIEPDGRPVFRGHLVDVFGTLTRQTCEVTLRTKNGVVLPAQLQSIGMDNGAGTIDSCRMAVSDISKLKEAEAALKKSEESYRTLVEYSPEAIAIHTGGVYVYANPAAVSLFGARDMKELLGRRILDLVHPAYRQIAEGHLRRTDARAGSSAWKELKLLRLDGRTADVETDEITVPVPMPMTMTMPLQPGGQRPVLVVFRDISHRKRAEERLKTTHAELERRASELDAVNRELEAFAYTVSHDLKAPLRSMEGFSQAVLEDYADRIDEAGKDYLRRVTSASRRMTQLIDAMLSMARLTGGELHEKAVDLSSLAQVVAQDLRKQDAERRVEFVIAGNVKGNGDATMLEVVFQNLFENAWKFTGRHPAARIEFGAIDMDGNMVYFVRDDGAGFDMQYADKLFQPFKRLHREADFPGLGIGLAIAHRIIMRHGGRIWADSKPEKGATFYFTLPGQKKKD